MTTVIMVSAFKGGSCKTFTIKELAAVCARSGLLTVVIDGDMQGNAGNSMGVRPTDGFYRLISEGSTWKKELIEVPTDFTNRTDQALLVLPSGFQTSNLKKNVDTVPMMVNQIENLRGWADVVLIDSAPGFDDIHAGAYAASDYVILPTLMELDSVESLSQTLKIMEATMSAGGKIPQILGILPHRFSPKLSSNLMMHDMLKVLYRANYRLFDPVFESVSVLDARNRNMSIHAHSETITGGGFGRRFDKRTANKTVKNFDEAIGDVVVDLIKQGVPVV